jgi:hypothetical protein
VRILGQESLSFLQRFADQRYFTVLEVTQPAVDDASRTARRARSEIVLFQEENPAAAAGAFPGNSNPIDSPANDYDLKSLVVNWWTVFLRQLHCL